MYDRNLSRIILLFLVLLFPAYPMTDAGATDYSGGYQQGSTVQGGQPSGQPAQNSQQPVPQDPDQQAPGGQPVGQQGQFQQQPAMQPSFPDQSQTGGQTPGQPPGQMMAGQSTCTVKISSDRTVISLMEAGSAQAREHVSINPDRVQKVLTSPDGNWSLVMFKVRGESQFGAIPVDLAMCEAQESVDIPAVTDNAQFEGETVTLVYPDGMQKKLSLRSK